MAICSEQVEKQGENRLDIRNADFDRLVRRPGFDGELLQRDGRPSLILGSGGSNRLRGALLQGLLRHAISIGASGKVEAAADPERGESVAWA